jgi:hypothetical protein
MKKLEFGFKCKDIVTGFEGILKARGMFLTGCDRVALSTDKKDEEERWFDIPAIKIVDEGVFQELQETGQCNMFDDLEDAKYELGIKVKDKITEFTGTIIAKSISISGDITYAISPKFDSQSRDNSATWTDEGRIEVIKEAKVVVNNEKRTGGATPNLKCR